MPRMENELLQLSENIASNTLKVRTGAAERLNSLLDNPEARDAISHNVSIDFGSKDLLNHVLQGLKKQIEKYARTERPDKWLTVFNSCVQKIMGIISQNPLLIDSSYLVEKFISILEDESLLTFCGTQFIQIIISYFSANDVTLCRVKLAQWNDLLDILVDLYLDSNSITKILILQAVRTVLQEGVKHSYILIHLPQFVEKFERIFLSASEDCMRREAFSVNYTLCEVLAVQNTSLVDKHSRKILPKIIENYYLARHDDMKEVSVKFFHLVLILSTLPDASSDDETSWNCLKLKMFNILDTELKHVVKISENRKFSVSPILVKFGACLYMDLIRSKFITHSSRGNDEQARKRARFNENFQGLLDMVNPANQEIDLGWFCILCEIVINHRDLHLLEGEMEKVVKILELSQMSLKADVLMEYFCGAAAILLTETKRNPKCREIFLTIAQRILKLSSIDAFSADLISKIIACGIIPLRQRVKIIEDFLGNKEETREMKILITAFNDANAKEIFFSKNPLNTITTWTSTSTDVLVKLQPNLVAEMVVVYLVNAIRLEETRPEDVRKSKIIDKEYSEAMKEIQGNLNDKFLCKFIEKSEEKTKGIPQRGQLVGIHLQELMRSLCVLPINIPSEVAALYFTKRAEIFLRIHNAVKKVLLNEVENFLVMLRSEVMKNIQEVERRLTEKKRELSRSHIMSLIERLSHFFKEDNQGLIRDCEVSGIVKYVAEHFQNCYSHLGGANEESYRVILTNCLQCMVHMHSFHAVSVENSWRRITDSLLDSETKATRRITLDVLKTIVQMPYADSLADWTCTEIEDLTSKFNKCPEVLEELLGIIRDAAVYFKDNNPENLDKILELFTKLLNISLKNIYRPQIAKILIEHIVHFFLNGVADDQDTAETFIEVLKRFLNSSLFTIQMSVVRALVEIFKDGTKVDFVYFPKDDLANFFVNNEDSAENKFAIIVQLFQGLFINCLPARRFMLFIFADMLSQQNEVDARLARLHDERFNRQASVWRKYVEYCMPDMVELWSRCAKPVESHCEMTQRHQRLPPPHGRLVGYSYKLVTCPKSTTPSEPPLSLVHTPLLCSSPRALACRSWSPIARDAPRLPKGRRTAALFPLLEFLSSAECHMRHIPGLLGKTFGNSVTFGTTMFGMLAFGVCAKIFPQLAGGTHMIMSSRRKQFSLPTNIAGCSSRVAFMDKYRQIFPKFLIYHGQEKVLKELGASDPKELAKNSMLECFPFILLEHNEKCRKMREFFERIFGNTGDFAKQNGVLILQKLFENFWDSAEFKKLFGFSHSELMLSELQLNCEQFQRCLDKLNWDFSDSDGNFFSTLCHTEPFEVVKILMSLKQAIYRAPDTLEMLNPILRFVHFSRRLTAVVKSDSLDSTVKSFFFCDVTRFILHLVTTVDFPHNVMKSLLQEFYAVFEQNFDNARDGVKDQLEFAVEKLTKIVRSVENEDVKSTALKTLRFLFIEKQTDLVDVLKVINNMPREVEFDAIRETQDVIVNMNFSSSCDLLMEETVENESNLVKDIDHFLVIKNPNIDSIKHLKRKLSKNPAKLADIYQQVNSQATDTILHKLTDVLVKCTQSEDDSVSLEATKCLSEMGYLEVNQSKSTSNPMEGRKKTKIFYAEQIILTYEKIIQSLQELQQNSDVSVSNAATATLNAIFSDIIGREMRSMKNRKIFMSTKRCKQVLNISESSVNCQSLRQLFRAETGDTHEMWIGRVAGKILEACSCSALKKITTKRTSFAEFLVPTLISLLLSIHYRPINGEIQQSVKDFFENYSKDKTDNIASIHLNKKSIQIMLTICDSIRFYNAVSYHDSNNAKTFQRIELSNLQIADAACYSENFTVSLVFAEMWIAEQMNIEKKTSRDILGTAIREILIKCYEAIEENDAAKPFYDLEEMRLWYLNNDSSIGRCFVERDTANALKLEQSDQYEQLLQRSGLHYLTNYLSPEQNFNCAWRMGDWNVLEKDSSADKNCDFERDHYKALKNVMKGDENLTWLSIEKSRLSLVESMRRKNPQSSRIFCNHFTMLRQMQQIEDFSLAFFSGDREDALVRLYDKWQWHDTLPCTSFVEKEKILAQRLAILSAANDVKMTAEKHKTLLRLVHEARDANCDNIAIKYLKHLRSLTLDDEIESKMLLEDAQLCKKFGYTDLAKKLFSSLVCDQKYESFFTRITGLWTCGEFFSDNMSENPSEIYQDYFLKAKNEVNDYQKRCQSVGNEMKSIQEEKIKIFTAVAKFADKIYTERDKYLNSNEYKEKCHYIELTQKEAQKLSAQKSSSAELKKRNYMKRYILMKNSELDKNEIECIRNDRNQYLSIAIDYYVCLAVFGENCDVYISRLVSLWCSNHSEKKVTEILTRVIDQVPSYKFLKVLPQLASRLGHSNMAFRNLVEKTIERCCSDHPYHSLNHIMALQNANNDAEEDSFDESSHMLQTNAKKIIQRLRSNCKVKNIVEELNDVSVAFIELANKTIEPISQTLKLSPNEKILKMGNKRLFHLPTVNLPVRKDCNYANITYVTQWSNEFSILSGINVPKRLVCICSDGINRSIIVKGNDDLRQDALMQQVFLYINDIFRRESHMQKLQIRTYKIIPLTKRSGFMEFCENSTPFTTYLSRAHARYRPSEPSYNDARRIIQSYAQQDPQTKLSEYLKLCEKVKPVFYNYFLEQFQDSRQWYERRLAYINTVASTSMVGFILGIGDRHLGNILLDQKTAEIIHIDFGIAFERGVIQNTPELVPFRLTRDIVSAMGFLGVDGIFRRSCEMTMEVLRENQATINTILEVLLYDPLCNWSTSQQSEKSASSNESMHVSEQKNASAARALFRVNERLSGRDSNSTTVHAVGTQVERLIQQAINPANLSRMFCGWSAFY
ncbi:uncharacterized protein LOC132259165 [Phlebotomus argentipes]|uniref:uncharacterized protein LOC132259165 n=1 Tax=Phlebotomus argentipes TaxID=94469 RepID=UPI0028932306|nr:uncharacterized protein LOC132259165 [Phlebotomus argentipes]